MKLIFPIIFIITYIIASFTGLSLGYTATSPWYTHITWMFMHGNIIHLSMNCFVFYAMFRAVERFIHPYVLLLVIIPVTISASFAFYYSLPVVGASGMVYTLVGVYFNLINSGKLYYPNRLSKAVGYASVSISLVISLIKPSSAGLIHIYCFGFGYLLLLIFNKIRYGYII